VSQSKVRIAVVDDEPSVAKLIARVLRMHDYEVWVAPDCKTLITAVAESPDCIDLLVTDQSMPEMTGAALVKVARMHAPQLPVLLITGYSAEIARSDVQSWGCSAYLTKPLDIQLLFRQVNQLLCSASAHGAIAP
jgi:DNA-binding response OmpR family regulator